MVQDEITHKIVRRPNGSVQDYKQFCDCFVEHARTSGEVDKIHSPVQNVPLQKAPQGGTSTIA